MAEFARQIQSAFNGVVAAVRQAHVVNKIFSGDGLGKHFVASDADYMIGDFIAVLGEHLYPRCKYRVIIMYYIDVK